MRSTPNRTRPHYQEVESACPRPTASLEAELLERPGHRVGMAWTVWACISPLAHHHPEQLHECDGRFDPLGIVGSGVSNRAAIGWEDLPIVRDVPSMVTDAFTKNLIELSSVVIRKTGTCARATEGSTPDAKRQRIVKRNFPYDSPAPSLVALSGIGSRVCPRIVRAPRPYWPSQAQVTTGETREMTWSGLGGGGGCLARPRSLNQ